jgi:glycerol uptake facilitator protein
MSALAGEFLGTMLLIIFGCGVVAGVLLKSSKSEHAGWLVINIGWGLGVSIAIYAAGKLSGAHLNPAVTIGLASIGEFPWDKVLGYILAQVAGAFAGAVIVWFHYLPHWKATPDAGLKLAVFSTGPAIRRTWSNLLSEISGTTLLLVGLMAIGSNHFADGLNPMVVGALVVAIGTSLGGTTGYAINPARDLGPRIAHSLLAIHGKGSSDWNYAWIPVAGPLIGGLFGSMLSVAVFRHQIPFLLWFVAPAVLLVAVLAVLEENRIKQ